MSRSRAQDPDSDGAAARVDDAMECGLDRERPAVAWKYKGERLAVRAPVHVQYQFVYDDSEGDEIWQLDDCLIGRKTT